MSKSPSADPRPDLAVPGDTLSRGAPFELRQAVPELPTELMPILENTLRRCYWHGQNPLRYSQG
jgi:hypothetical protein